jgi:hypothetical protein
MPNTTMFIENYKSFIKKRNNNREGKSLQSVKKSINSYINDNKNRVINTLILFGCWNHIDCFSKNYKKHPIYRDIVIKKIKSEKEKLIIVAGDNWYSQNYLHNNIVYKYYPYSVLTSGYSLLFKNTSKNIDIILGNNNENNDNVEEDANLKAIPKDKIFIIKIQETDKPDKEYQLIDPYMIPKVHKDVDLISSHSSAFDSSTDSKSRKDRMDRRERNSTPIIEKDKNAPILGLQLDIKSKM